MDSYVLYKSGNKWAFVDCIYIHVVNIVYLNQIPFRSNVSAYCRLYVTYINITIQKQKGKNGGENFCKLILELLMNAGNSFKFIKSDFEERLRLVEFKISKKNTINYN